MYHSNRLTEANNVTIATVWPADNTLSYSFRDFKKGMVTLFIYSQLLISMIRRNLLPSLEQNSEVKAQSHLIIYFILFVLQI